ncbi:phage major tail tube protein [Eubacterium pyruvativorans]|uniref:phage major tail tube protein n=1 Tax=Eubacterium pyruvativorans TaxID=155865 RepID=UPI0015630616|nr:phage major tail tube protein [Eubacterium pyruvativorans]
MTASGVIPQVITNFNVYDNGTERLMGVADEVKLPDLQSKTTTLDAAGTAGESDIPIPGQLQSLSSEINLNVTDSQFFRSIHTGGSMNVTLRGSVQTIDAATAQVTNVPLVVVMKGLMKQVTSGSVKKSDSMGASVTIEILYYSYRYNNNEDLDVEIDKLNNVYKIGDTDLSADISSQI